MFVKLKGVDTGSRDVLDLFEARTVNFEWLLMMINDRLGYGIGLEDGTSGRSNRRLGVQKHRTKSQFGRIFLVYRRRVGYVERSRVIGLSRRCISATTAWSN